MVFLIDQPLITHCCQMGRMSIIDKTVTLMMKLKIQHFLKCLKKDSYAERSSFDSQHLAQITTPICKFMSIDFFFWTSAVLIVKKEKNCTSQRVRQAPFCMPLFSFKSFALGCVCEGKGSQIQLKFKYEYQCTRVIRTKSSQIQNTKSSISKRASIRKPGQVPSSLERTK